MHPTQNRCRKVNLPMLDSIMQRRLSGLTHLIGNNKSWITFFALAFRAGFDFAVGSKFSFPPSRRIPQVSYMVFHDNIQSLRHKGAPAISMTSQHTYVSSSHRMQERRCGKWGFCNHMHQLYRISPQKFILAGIWHPSIYIKHPSSMRGGSHSLHDRTWREFRSNNEPIWHRAWPRTDGSQHSTDVTATSKAGRGREKKTIKISIICTSEKYCRYIKRSTTHRCWSTLWTCRASAGGRHRHYLGLQRQSLLHNRHSALGCRERKAFFRLAYLLASNYMTGKSQFEGDINGYLAPTNSIVNHGEADITQTGVPNFCESKQKWLRLLQVTISKTLKPKRSRLRNSAHKPRLLWPKEGPHRNTHLS